MTDKQHRELMVRLSNIEALLKALVGEEAARKAVGMTAGSGVSEGHPPRREAEHKVDGMV